MNWLGRREPELYGRTTAAELDARLRDYAETLGFTLDIVADAAIRSSDR